MLEDVTELKLARIALRRHAEFDTLLVDVTSQLLEVPPEQFESAVHDALSELSRFYGLVRAAVLRFADGFPVEVSHASAGIEDPRVLARVRDREVRWLSSVHGQLFRGRHLVRTLGAEREPQPRDGGPTLAVAVPVVTNESHALVCYPSSGAPELSEHVVDQWRSFAKLTVSVLSRDQRDRGRVTDPASGSQRRHGRAVDLVGESRELRHVLEAVDVVAATQATVLIQGESGVGKELVARAIHDRSSRGTEPLVTVNCASIPRELFESEFFGHVRGAFTGAHRDRVGRFELAEGGTIFLDEVAEIPLELQSKLLRVLQEREFERVGDHRTHRLDARIIAATNRDLQEEMETGKFRQDLYYRLSVFPIHVPPLRERPEDVLALARHFVEVHSAELGRKGLALSEEHKEALLAHQWPGNVRELHNVIERAVIQSVQPPLRIELAPVRRSRPEILRDRTAQPFLTAAELRECERESILAALTKSEWRVSGKGGAAELLGMRPSTLRDRLQLLGIRRP